MSTFETVIILVVGVMFLAIIWIITELQDVKKLPETKNTFNNETLKLRLQAYERLTMLAERIALQNLITRVSNAGLSAKQMQGALVEAIKSEYDYNASQQVYISAEAWRAINNLKEQNIYIINQLGATLPPQASGMDLNKQIIEYLMSNPKASLHTMVLEALNFEAKKIM